MPLCPSPLPLPLPLGFASCLFPLASAPVVGGGGLSRCLSLCPCCLLPLSSMVGGVVLLPLVVPLLHLTSVVGSGGVAMLPLVVPLLPICLLPLPLASSLPLVPLVRCRFASCLCGLPLPLPLVPLVPLALASLASPGPIWAYGRIKTKTYKTKLPGKQAGSCLPQAQSGPRGRALAEI